MLNLMERIQAFGQLGEKISSIDNSTFASLFDQARNQNPWFTTENINLSLTGIRKLLDTESLTKWASAYMWPPNPTPKAVALVLAGNIPLVGFHDVLTVLISGNIAIVKQSSKDSLLLPFLLNQLVTIEPGFQSCIRWADILKNFDAVIATGSDNAARYFEYYFGKYPSIIRKNRTSCAIITGNEKGSDLQQLGTDVFSHFGLGCRNVSKLFIPQDFPLSDLLDCWKEFHTIIHHHKYFNNYEYQKAIMMVNNVPHLDSGFVLLTQNEKMVSPIGVVYYEHYNTPDELKEKLKQSEDKIQCIIGSEPIATIPFGQAQFPGPSDYADNVDTMEFLLNLN